MNKVFVEMTYEEYINFMESKGKVNIQEAINEMIELSYTCNYNHINGKNYYCYQDEKYAVNIYER